MSTWKENLIFNLQKRLRREGEVHYETRWKIEAAWNAECRMQFPSEKASRNGTRTGMMSASAQTPWGQLISDAPRSFESGDSVAAHKLNQFHDAEPASQRWFTWKTPRLMETEAPRSKYTDSVQLRLPLSLVNDIHRGLSSIKLSTTNDHLWQRLQVEHCEAEGVRTRPTCKLLVLCHTRFLDGSLFRKSWRFDLSFSEVLRYI